MLILLTVCHVIYVILLLEFNRFPELSTTSSIFPGLSSPVINATVKFYSGFPRPIQILYKYILSLDWMLFWWKSKTEKKKTLSWFHCLWLKQCYCHWHSIVEQRTRKIPPTNIVLLTSDDNQSLWCNVLNFPGEKCKKHINTKLRCLRETQGNLTNSFDWLLGHFNVYIMNLGTVG